MNRKKESKVVPNVRFKGFTDDWKQRKLEEVCSRVQGNDGRMDLPTLTISAANGWMNQEDRFSGNIAGKEQKNYTLLHKGELSYNHGNSKLAKYGTVFSLQSYKEALVPRVYHSFKAEKGSPDFIEYYFATKLPDRELGKLISSGARMDGLLNIGYNEFMGIQMLFPSVEEQKQISNYFRSLEHFITLHQQKITLLTKLKKTMLEKMFPKKGSVIPEIRFNGFANAWEQRKLGELAFFNPKEKLPDVFEYVDLESVVGIEMLSHRTEEKATAPSRAQRLAHTGDLFYQTVRPYQKNNYLFENSEKHYVFSTGYAQLRPLVDGYFLLSLVQNGQFVKTVLDNCTGTNYPAINANDLAEIDVFYPKDEHEQHQIGEYFRHLDHLITLHQRKLDMLKKLKSACLSEMFI